MPVDDDEEEEKTNVVVIVKGNGNMKGNYQPSKWAKFE